MFSGASGFAVLAEYSRARLLRSALEPLMAPYVNGLEVSTMFWPLTSERSRSSSMEMEAQHVSAML
jgi:hypothetical protein